MKTLLEELGSVVLETELKLQEMTELDAVFGNFRQFWPFRITLQK